MADAALPDLVDRMQLEPQLVPVRKTLYLVYKTTNLVNGRIYIGAHITKDRDDGYLGSGINIRRAIKKYGLAFFRKEILFSLKTPKAMLAKERELVTPEFVARKDTYNIAVGGEDGFLLINESGRNLYGRNAENALLVQPLAHEALKALRADPEWRAKYAKSVSDPMKDSYEYRLNPFLGKRHSAETKEKIGRANSAHQSGAGNSQYGTCWITNGVDDKRINKLQLDVWIRKGWRAGRAPSKKFLPKNKQQNNDGL